MWFSREKFPDVETPPDGYALGYAAGEKSCAQAVIFAHSYIDLLERQVKALKEELNKKGNPCELCDKERTFTTAELAGHAITADRLANGSSVEISQLQARENMSKDLKHL